MFEESLIESAGKLKTHRGATTILSFSLQALAVLFVVMVPLLFTQAIPLSPVSVSHLVAPPPPPPPPPPAAAQAARPQPTHAEAVETELREPVRVPQKVAMIKESAPESSAPPAVGAVAGGVPGGVPGGQMGGVIGGVLGATTAAVPKVATPEKVRVSQGVSEGLLQKRVTPTYPAIAKQAHIQGAVVLQASIGKDGNVQNVRVVSGPAMLSPAAINAVKQWKYKPYFLNGQPVEVETTITVNFRLS